MTMLFALSIGLYLLYRAQRNPRRRAGLPPLSLGLRVLLRGGGWVAIIYAWPLAARAAGWSLGTLYWIATAGLLGIALVIVEAIRQQRAQATGQSHGTASGTATDFSR
jgi:hypothetical protein